MRIDRMNDFKLCTGNQIETFKITEIVCKGCGEYKATSEYYTCSKGKNGIRTKCKRCNSITAAKRRLKKQAKARG